MGIEPGQMLHIGDDPRHDQQSPRSAGVNALLRDRDCSADGGEEGRKEGRKEGRNYVIHSLKDLW